MSLADIVRSGISIANTITENGDLQEPVTLDRWTGQSGTGVPVYNDGGDGESIPALVEYAVDHIYDRSGERIPVKAKVTFLRPLTSNGATGREEPLDPRDRITLPNGSYGPIASVSGLVDGGTAYPYMLEVYVGK